MKRHLLDLRGRSPLAWIILGAVAGLIVGSLPTLFLNPGGLVYWAATASGGALMGLKLWEWEDRDVGLLSLPKLTGALLVASITIAALLHDQGYVSLGAVLLIPLVLLVVLVFLAATVHAADNDEIPELGIWLALVDPAFWRRFLWKEPQPERELTLKDLDNGSE